MSRSSSQVISPVDSANPVSLPHPVLRAALENLDVQLEEELTRYRRQKRLQPNAQRKFGVSSKLLHDRLYAQTDLQLPQFPCLSPIASDAPPPPAASPATTAAPLPESASPPAEPTPAQVSSAKGSPTHLPDTLPDLSSTEATQLAVLAADPEANLLQPPDAEPELPEDYLASSEELLRSIAEEDPQQRAVQPNQLLDTLLTPLGIGSLLLLMLSSATLGYLVMNPASLGFLTTQAPNPASPDAAPAQPSPVPGAIVSPSPNLAAREFVDLNLNTLSTLPKPSPIAPKQPSPSPSPQTASKPLEPIVPPSTPSSDLPPVSVPPEPAVIAPAPAADPRPAVSSSFSAPSPSRSTAPAAQPHAPAPEALTPEAVSEPAPDAENPTPEVAANSSPARSNYYYVVTPYRSDSELNQVQQAVPDAYVRNFSDGASVQMGAFSDESKAQEQIQELQQQGIQAEIREPE